MLSQVSTFVLLKAHDPKRNLLLYSASVFLKGELRLDFILKFVQYLLVYDVFRWRLLNFLEKFVVFQPLCGLLDHLLVYTTGSTVVTYILIESNVS